MIRFRALVTVIVGIVLLSPASAIPAQAQALPSADPILISIDPDYPRPFQTITISPSSNLVDLASSQVTIAVNGRVVESGSGSISGVGAVGAAGTKTTITVTVVNNGRTYKKSLIISPADVALIVEPISTTHPFYPGGSLVASEGQLRLVAIPDFRTAAGVVIPPASLVYTWRLGDQILQSSSGIGHSTVVATAPIRYRDAPITVTVATTDSSIVAEAAAQVSPVDPTIRIYQNDPLLGPMFDRAFTGSVVMTENEQTFRAVPYYFAADPALTWTVNSTVSGADQDITVRSNGNGQGTALLGISARVASTFQNATASLSVSFGQKKSLGIFGL